jgi:hypothetical protein
VVYGASHNVELETLKDGLPRWAAGVSRFPAAIQTPAMRFPTSLPTPSYPPRTDYPSIGKPCRIFS